MDSIKPTGPRNVAVVGPYLSGKTTLLEAIMFVTGGSTRKGGIGDNTQEAKDRGMGTELNVATTSFMGDSFTFLDCPGSVELFQETLHALRGADAAVVVCEPDTEKAMALAPLLKTIEDMELPHILFVNKVDRAVGSVQQVLDALQPASNLPLVLRHVPVIDDDSVTGYIDLASQRAYHYAPNAASTVIEISNDIEEIADGARYQMLEKLADFDDELMEKVLEEIAPEKDEVYGNLTRDFQEGLIVPVLLGSAEREHGVRRLLKALRHEVPSADKAATRISAHKTNGVVAQILKTYHTQHGGKLSIARIWRGSIKDGMILNGERVSGLFSMKGQEQEKLAEASAGDIIGLGRLDKAGTGDTLSDGEAVDLPVSEVLEPVFALSIAAEKRDDEVKLSGALQKIKDEDPSLIIVNREDTHQLVMQGQGDIHLKLAIARLKNKYGIAVTSGLPRVPYKEAIKKSVQQHGRHKKQSGGHGQFGDVHLEIKPLPRGTGFEFIDKIVGGSVPRQYIPAVESGVKDYLHKGPLGFPVVDVQVTLFDGQYHAVDSSEIAFKMAARIAMNEGMKNCGPVLLEPILRVDVTVPSEFTPRVNQIISGRRGQILGFDGRPDWVGWDIVSSQLPQSEIQDLIIELRSATQGTGSYSARFDRLQELTGRLADDIVEAHKNEEAA